MVNREKENASSGNRTRAARVAGEHSTTEPTTLHIVPKPKYVYFNRIYGHYLVMLRWIKCLCACLYLFVKRHCKGKKQVKLPLMDIEQEQWSS